MKELKEELKDEQLNEVAGGKKFTQTDYMKAKQDLLEKEKKAKEAMNPKRAF
jgi:hypothetical protein